MIAASAAEGAGYTALGGAVLGVITAVIRYLDRRPGSRASAADSLVETAGKVSELATQYATEAAQSHRDELARIVDELATERQAREALLERIVILETNSENWRRHAELYRSTLEAHGIPVPALP